MEQIFTFRVDEETGQMLQLLAVKTFRSRAGVLRWLINLAIQNPSLVSPEIGESADNTSTSFVDLIKKDGQEELK